MKGFRSAGNSPVLATLGVSITAVVWLFVLAANSSIEGVRGDTVELTVAAFNIQVPHHLHRVFDWIGKKSM